MNDDDVMVCSQGEWQFDDSIWLEWKLGCKFVKWGSWNNELSRAKFVQTNWEFILLSFWKVLEKDLKLDGGMDRKIDG